MDFRMATEGMMTMEYKQAVIANNLANVGTAGYRREVMDVSSFTEVLSKQIGANFEGGDLTGEIIPAAVSPNIRGTLYTTSRTSFSQGALKLTGNQFDMALDDNGKGFFTVHGRDGIRFTRNGAFRLSVDGYLVTQDGAKVLGHRGAIKVDGNSFQVKDNGEIVVNDKVIDKFMITEFFDPRALSKDGENQFNAHDGFRVSENFQLKQGFLEMANVNAVKEMTDMLMAQKAYEASSKVLGAQDQALRKSVNEIGKAQ
jgi:flagellar basal-body rod protein FlgF